MGRSNTYSTFVPFFNVVVDVVVVIFVVFFDIAVSFGNIFTADVLARGVKRARFLNAFGSLSLSVTLLPLQNTFWQYMALTCSIPRILAPAT